MSSLGVDLGVMVVVLGRKAVEAPPPPELGDVLTLEDGVTELLDEAGEPLEIG